MVVSWTALIQVWPESATREARFFSSSGKPTYTSQTPKFMLHPGAQPAGRSWHYSLACGWRLVCGCFPVSKSGNFSGDPPKIPKTTAELPPWRFRDISELPGVLRLRCEWPNTPRTPATARLHRPHFALCFPTLPALGLWSSGGVCMVPAR